PQILDGLKTTRANLLKDASLKEMPVIKPEHCQRAWLDDEDLSSFANVLQQDFACPKCLVFGCLDQSLRQRSAAIRGDFGEHQVNAYRFENVNRRKSPFGRAVIGKDIGKERSASTAVGWFRARCMPCCTRQCFIREWR